MDFAPGAAPGAKSITLHHLVGHRLGHERADRHAAARAASATSAADQRRTFARGDGEQLVDRHAERVGHLDQHGERRIAVAGFEVRDGRARHAPRPWPARPASARAHGAGSRGCARGGARDRVVGASRPSRRLSASVDMRPSRACDDALAVSADHRHIANPRSQPMDEHHAHASPDSPLARAPSPAARPGSAWRWCASLRARAVRTSPSSRATPRASTQVARAQPRHARHRRRRRGARTTSIRIALQVAGRARRARRAGQQRLEPRPGAAGAARRHRVRGPRAGAGDQPARAVPADQGAARRARRVGARGPRRAWCVNISSDAAVNAYAGWGAYGASKAALRHLSAHLGRGTARRTACASWRSTPATWTRRCMRWPCPTPTRRR